MATIIREAKPVARKRHHCMASDWIDAILKDFVYECKPTYAELRAVVKARKNNWCILPGQQYVMQVVKDGYDFWVFRAIPELHAICLKYDLYEEV